MTGLNMVFVPVYEHGRWWCVMFSFNRREIVVVDPQEPTNSVDLHHLSLMDLIHAFEELLIVVDSSREVGELRSWEKVSMVVEGANDWESSVLILKAIKACDDCLCYHYTIPRYKYGLSMHLCQDLFSDFNEAKDSVGEMIQTWRASMKMLK